MLSSITDTPRETIVVAGDNHGCIKSDIIYFSGSQKMESNLAQDESAGGKVGADTVVIRFAVSDPENPFDWKPTKKWHAISFHSRVHLHRVNAERRQQGSHLCRAAV